MANEAQIEVYKQQRASQEKFVYFLLAAAGACIAFAITKTDNSDLHFTDGICGLAVLSWAVSFYAGCRHLTVSSVVMYSNWELLRVEAGQHPNARDRLTIAAASSAIREAIEEFANTGGRWARVQFQLILVGAAFYVIWHVVQMFLRTKA